MAEPKKYLLDTNILVEAHKRYYGFDLCPGFWDAIIRQYSANRIFSLDRVKREIVPSKDQQKIAEGEDRLAKWAQLETPKGFFKKSDTPPIIRQFGELVAWVQSEQQYKPEAKAEFAEVADGWLIACAQAEGLILVTDEVYNSDIKRKVPIPNVCRQFRVEYMNTFQMLRELEIRFVERRIGEQD